jgi:hypothetical protein
VSEKNETKKQIERREWKEYKSESALQPLERPLTKDRTHGTTFFENSGSDRHRRFFNEEEEQGRVLIVLLTTLDTFNERNVRQPRIVEFEGVLSLEQIVAIDCGCSVQ